MKKPNEQENDTGQVRENKRKSLLVVSNPPKTENESSKGHGEEQQGKPSTQASTKNQKVLSESEPENGSETIPKKSRKPKSLMPVPKLPSEKKRAEQALQRLKIKPESLASAPQITPLLKNAEGGLKSVLGAMRFAAQDEVIGAFLKKYDSIPIGDRERVPWEAVALAAKVNMNHLLGSITLALASQSANTSRIIAVTNHPKITRARVKWGKMASGERDRTQLDIMVGALPSAKGPTFIGKAVFGSGGSGGGDKEDDEPSTPAAVFDSSDSYDELFPSANEVQDKLVPIRQKLLEG